MSNTKRWLIIFASMLVALGLYYGLPGEFTIGGETIVLPELARRTLCIFAVAVIFWSTEVIPLFATSLCLVGFEILFIAGAGGMGERFSEISGTVEQVQKYPPASAFLVPFASSIIILFMGGFLLSAAVTKHGLDKAIAARLLRPFSHRPLLLIFAVLLITAFFSMWMSNTATAVMMIAITAPLVKQLPEDDHFHRAVILAVPFGANIGGIGTLIGTPPNAVALAALRQRFPELNLTFVDWMLMAVPLAMILLVFLGFTLYFMFPPRKGLQLPELKKPIEKITPKGWATLIILGSAIFLWVASGLEITVGSFTLNTKQYLGLSWAAVALLAAAALTAFGVLERKDVDSIDWNVLILMWGGLALGSAMELTGLVDVIAALPFAQLSGILLVVIVATLALVMSTFMSNTATANVLVPMVIAIAVGAAATPQEGVSAAIQLALLTALACSFAMALPVSTPPNAIAFATGKIPAWALVRSGGVVSVICVIVMMMGHQIVLPWFVKLTPASVALASQPMP